MKNHSFLMWVYLFFALLGLIIPWYFNYQFMMTGETFTPQKFIAAGMVSPLASSLTMDFMIAASALFTFMIVEGRRLKMKHMWILYVSTFLVAIAFSAPLFLYLRERKLVQISKD